MKIQVIGYEGQKSKFTNMQYSLFDSPLSLDEFDVNVIDLSCEYIWENSSDSINSVNKMNDFRSIQTMVCYKKSSKILYILPQNVKFKYNYRSHEGRYRGNTALKDMLKNFAQEIIPKILPPRSGNLNMAFELTKTKIEDREFPAAFYFMTKDAIITRSFSSEKSTTICYDSNISDIYLTTLNVSETEEDLQIFIDYLFLNNELEDKPAWLDNIVFGDDSKQQDIIRLNEEVIEDAQNKIDSANKALLRNERFKSILYTSSDDLVSVIFDILEQLLDCDLSGFVDEKKEDFRIQKEQCTFIGEIKGVSSNVKNEYISQVDVHCQGYYDYLEENNLQETVKPLLVINPLRFKEPSEREPVHEKQISLAKKYGCLIIETSTLLWVFDNFKKGRISTEQCINVFAGITGLLNKKDFILDS